MKKIKLILVLTLAFALLIRYDSSNLNASKYSKLNEIQLDYKGKSEEQIYLNKTLKSKSSLLEELKAIDLELNNSEDKIIGIPTALALIDKKDQFGKEEVYELLRTSNNAELFETALIEIFIRNNNNSRELIPLFYNSHLSIGAKESIIIKSDFTVDELEKICNDYDNSFSVLAMKKLMGMDLNRAYKFSTNLLLNSNTRITDNDLYIAALGIEKYFSKATNGDESKKDVVSVLKKNIEARPNIKEDITRDRVVYALSKSQDFEDFKYIIYNEKIDDELKISAIESNLSLIIKKIESGLTDEDFKCIETAMHILPINEIGEALTQNLDKSMIINKSEAIKLIEFIRKNGVSGVFKHD